MNVILEHDTLHLYEHDTLVKFRLKLYIYICHCEQIQFNETGCG